MTVDHLDLTRLVRGPEGLYFERKSLFEGPEGRKKARDRRAIRDDVAQVTAAFANADGGVLVLGVEDDGTPTGHALPPDAVDDVLVVPERRLTPPQVRGERATLDGKEILVFEVRPAFAAVMVQGDGYPCRVADQVVHMEAAKITAWKEQGLVKSWEVLRSERTVEDLDPDLLATARGASGLRAPSVDDYLLRRRLADRRGPALVLRHAAELLFARESFLIDHPNASVRVFRVVGTERKLGAQHNVEELPRFEGNASVVVDAVFTTIRGLLRRPQRLRGLRFEEVPEYPTFAWQEAIINAVAHRDYGTTGRSVEVWLYDDRLEVTSPGGLVAEVPVEALHERARIHMSRNPLLVRGLVDLGLMREQGEGIPRMFAEMEVQFLATPELSVSAHEFRVTLRNAPLIRPGDAEWLAGLQQEALSDPQARAMALARIRGQVSNAALRDASGLDTLAASAELRDLRDRGLLELQGAGSAAFYVVGPRAEELGGRRSGAGRAPADRPDLGPDRPEFPEADRPDLGPDRPEFPEADRPDLGPDRPEFPEADRPDLPPELGRLVAELGERPRQAQLRAVIQGLCAWRALRPAELAALLSQRADNLTKRHLSPMVEAGVLERTHADNPNHPEQAYRAKQPGLPGVTTGGQGG